MNAILRTIAWILAAAAAFATLGPPTYRPHSDLGQDGEHALAFVLVGLAFGLAYGRNRWATAAISVALIGLLEILQLWMPGRHARLGDFVVDAMAACAGLALAAGLDWAIRRASTQRGNVLTQKSPRARGPRGSIAIRSCLVDDLDDPARARLDNHAAFVDHSIVIFSVARHRPQHDRVRQRLADHHLLANHD